MSIFSEFASLIYPKRRPDSAPAPANGPVLDSSRFKLDWATVGDQEGELRCGKQRIHVCLWEAVAGKPSSPNDFVLVKTPKMVEEFIETVRAIEPKNMFEIGVFKGGSVVAYNEILHPRKFVAVDLMQHLTNDLDAYLKSPDVSGRVSVHVNVNQADRTRLARIFADEFGGEALDVVVDDGSHFLHETRESFRELFPRLRRGGIYVIEDWAWAHWPGEHWQVERGGDYFKGKEPMSSFIVELVAMSASRPSLVEQLQIRHSSVYVVKGWENVEPGFEPSRYCLNRGAPLPRFRA